MNKKGFTLTELMIALAIIGILAAIAVPAYYGYTKKATIRAGEASLTDYQLISESLHAENHQYAPINAPDGAYQLLRNPNRQVTQDTITWFQYNTNGEIQSKRAVCNVPADGLCLDFKPSLHFSYRVTFSPDSAGNTGQKYIIQVLDPARGNIPIIARNQDQPPPEYWPNL
jgi:prepilin-type N-terminal cleavage/methylation domain-containing protein